MSRLQNEPSPEMRKTRCNVKVLQFRLCRKGTHIRPTDTFWASACVSLSGGYMLVIFGPTSRSKFTANHTPSVIDGWPTPSTHSPVTKLRIHLRSFAIFSVPIKSPSKLSCVLCIRLGSLRVFERDTRLRGFCVGLFSLTSGSSLSARSGEEDALSWPFIIL